MNPGESERSLNSKGMGLSEESELQWTKDAGKTFLFVSFVVIPHKKMWLFFDGCGSEVKVRFVFDYVM